MKLRKYPYLWIKTTVLSVETLLMTKGSSVMYLTGKFVRFFFFLWFLFRIGDQIEKVSGFTIDQLVIFFLIFNFFDLIGQIFFRGIYWFRREVVTGEFDLTLLKPVDSLFQIMTKRTDILDVPLFLLVIAMLIKRSIGFGLNDWLLFGLMSVISFVLIAAIHIFVAAIGILTTEVDHTIMIYRDFSIMTMMPIDIYLRPIQILLTLIVPVGVIMTFPAKALMGILNWQSLGLAAGLSLLFFLLVLRFWRYALTQYSSASS